jgi:anti-sigma factor RsiW
VNQDVNLEAIVTELDKLPLEVRLSAFLDDELPQKEKTAIMRLLATDCAAQALLFRLKTGSEAGNAMFATLLDDPLPLSFLRAIRHGKAS